MENVMERNITTATQATLSTSRKLIATSISTILLTGACFASAPVWAQESDQSATQQQADELKDKDAEGEDTEIITKGRHDPCVGIRAVPVGEAMMACVILDHLLLHRGQVGENRGVIG